MTNWPRTKLKELCTLEKGITGLAKATPGPYPLVTTAADRRSCDSYQFDAKAVCIPLVSSTGHGKKTLNYVHYQEGKFAVGTILVAIIPKDARILNAKYLHIYLQKNKDSVLVPLMRGAANVSLGVRDIAEIEIPLPDIQMQADIIKKVEAVEFLEKQLDECKSQAELLIQSVLREAFSTDNPIAR